MSHEANRLRRLAERLDGTRETDLFVETRDLAVSLIRPPRPHFDARTLWHGDGLRGTEKLSVTKGTIPDTADAAFTTQSAFEKFVLPYYVRISTIDDLMGMLGTFYAADVICAYHDPSSETSTVPIDSGIVLLGKDGRKTFI